ncbi:MAG TPA: rhomboid family intramembrane serine protease [Gemmatimonadaceae bacterium]|nr:rhomboid family intramembrane serine protease [Gemmatimonadaceae bacterium]
MSYKIADEQDHPRITPAVQWLIGINVLVFFLQLTVVPAGAMARALGFQLSDLEGSWWSIFTYMFVHAGFWHLAVNMYTLWLFGPRVEHHWSGWGFSRFYVWCGLGGWLFHLVFDRGGLLMGASAAVLGVMLAYAMRWPDDEVYLFGIVPVKVRWLVAFVIVANLLSGMAAMNVVGGGSGVAYLAHLGGLAFAWLYLRTPSAQSIDRLRQRISQVPDMQDEPPRAIPRSLPRRERGQEVDEIVAKSKAALAKRPASPAVSQRPAREPRSEELNSVLDKISEHGLESLTADERLLLEEMSRKLRDS